MHPARFGNVPCGAFAKAKKDAKKDIGIQLYSVRDLIGSFGRNQHDYKPVLKALADMGYTSIEAASYNDGKFYGNTPEEFKRDVEAVGMKVLSSHCGKGLSDEELASGDFSESMKWWDQCIAAHKAAGMEYIVTPYLPVPKTLKEMQTYCDYLNAIGKKCREARNQIRLPQPRPRIPEDRGQGCHAGLHDRKHRP